MKNYQLEVYDHTIDRMLAKYGLELKDEVDQFLIDKQQTDLLLDSLKGKEKAK